LRVPGSADAGLVRRLGARRQGRRGDLALRGPAATRTTRDVSDVLGELARRSEEFRGLSAVHNVRLHTQGVKRSTTPSWASWSSASPARGHRRPGLMLVAYTAEPALGPPRRLSCSPAGRPPRRPAAPGAIPAMRAGTG